MKMMNLFFYFNKNVEVEQINTNVYMFILFLFGVLFNLCWPIYLFIYLVGYLVIPWGLVYMLKGLVNL